MAKKKKIKLMLASTIYGFQTEITQLFGILKAYGYEVLNSHMNTIAGIPGKSNTDACLAAVESCDAFFGIIRPFYSSGITHQEITKALVLNKPCWFAAHINVDFTRQLFKQYRFDPTGNKQPFPLAFKKTPVMDNLKVLDLYDEVINDGKPIEQRRWAAQFFHFNELQQYVETTFRDIDAVRKRCEEMNP